MEPASLTRWAALDYLRGLMALSILVFHFDKWTTGYWCPTTIQGKLGVYAVSIFFVLSGMALMATYQEKMQPTWRSLTTYAIKRVFRIFPLLWLATAATIVLDEGQRPAADVFLNFSGLFGFWDASRDIATGAWSIGCELVYYTLFPIILFLTRRKKWLVLLITAGMALVGFHAAFGLPAWPQYTPQNIWWPGYVQPVYHAFFFTAGMALVAYGSWLAAWPRWIWWVLMGVSLAVFLGFPLLERSNPEILIAGKVRIVFSCCAIVATAAWAYGLATLPGVFQRVLTWLGAISYSLYLLHPLVYRVIKAVYARYPHFQEVWLLPLAVMGSFLASHLVFNFLELPAMRFGARCAQRLRV